MADSKVSALTELAVQPADTDEFYINDGGVSKRITSLTMRTSIVLVTPALGTPTSGVITACTGAPTLAITNMTGTGTNLTFVNPALGTPASGVISNCTGSPTLTTLTVESVVAAVEAAEHGVGAIGTSSFGAPKTYRWTDRGVIITQIKFDLTGLASVADADDVIGLAALGAAYIGRNVVATNGVIFRAELSCIESSAGGGADVDVRTAASATAAYNDDGAAYTSLINGGSLVIGQTVVNNVPAAVANDYYYLVIGTSSAGTYSAGMYILTTYGHAVLA